ncbi:sigma-54 interaction domain-containing protein, partial [Candidatus Hydrogenedentota bacterium]
AGSSQYIVDLKNLIRKVGPLTSTILVSGESGTGKELVSRAIHGLSNRSERPFVAVNCGGIPETLLESELFGHVKGAFTGAITDKKGLFESADGGTLFLDELGETSPSFQVKLLRVLDEHAIKPVGSVVSKSVDVRVIAATNKNLEEMVAQETFREDLYYRLNVIPMETSPLRERKEDIALLANHFLAIYNAELGRNLKGFSQEALVILEEFPWPGNIRELRNITERAVALSSGDTIQSHDLPDHMRVQREGGPEAITATLTSTGIDLEANTATIEKRLVQQALDLAKGSHKEAAELLHLTPRTLRYRLQKYGLGGK